MNPLSPHARDLLARTKIADGPAPHSQARIYRALAESAVVSTVTLGVTAAEASRIATLASTATSSRLLTLLSAGKAGFFAATAVGLVSGSLLLAGVTRFLPTDAREKPVTAAAVPSVSKHNAAMKTAPAAPTTVTLPELPVGSETAKTAPPPLPSNRSPIGEETRLLSQVQQALREGNGQLALELLGRYRRDFGRGALVEEAVAAEVFARCAVGDVSGAKRTRAQFRRRFRGSPLELRVESSCAKERNADEPPPVD